MSLDLNTILKDWPYESGTVKVRKITGLDGRSQAENHNVHARHHAFE